MSAPLPKEIKTIPGLEEILQDEVSIKKGKDAVVASAQDIHGNTAYLTDIIEKGLALGKHVVLVTGDLHNHTHREQAYHQMGVVPDSNLILQHYVTSSLDDDADKRAFMVGQEVEKIGSLETFVSLLQSQYGLSDEQIEDQFVNPFKLYATEEFQEKVKEVLEKEEAQEVFAQMQQNQIALQIADSLISDYEATQLANVLNQYQGKVTVVNIHGNHGNMLEHRALQDKLTDKNMLVHGLTVRGAIEAGGMRVGIGSNTYGISNPSEDAVYGSEVAQALNPQMIPAGVAKHLTKEQLAMLTAQNVKNTPGYIINTNGGVEDEDLDAMIVHSEIGTPIGFEDGKSRYENYDDIGLVYLATKRLKEGGKVYAGHIHSDKEGVNDLGILTKRSRGIVLKKEGGKVREYEVNTANKNNYDPIAYPIDELRSKLEQEYQKVMQEMEKQYQQAA